MKKIILTLALFLGFITTLNAEPYIATQYCYGKTTASGKRVREGMIAGPKNLKFGTKVKINGRIYTVEDRGSAIFGNRVDIYTSSCFQARQFGRRKVDLQIL